MHYNKLISNKKKAFTLIELLIVIAIIGILFIVLVSKVDFATDKAKATGVQTDFRSFQVAFETVAKEHAGFNTFGWDTGDTNGNRIRDSYDKGDTNKNGKQDPGEVFVGSKTYGETWANVYTLINPADANDLSAIVALEEAINKNLDPKLHITIHDDLTITMANQARDPWGNEYHGYYITNATVDNKDRGAIVIYSNGANQEFGSEHSIENGIVSISIPGSNIYGKDDYAIASVYTYVNGYGEVKTQTSGFSQNQEAQSNSNNSNNGSNGGDLNNVPAIGETKQFATLITSSTLKDIYDLSTSPDKEYGQAAILMNNETHLSIALLDETTYTIYYEFYNASEDYWYSFSYATEGIVELGYVPEAGWYMFDDDSGEPIKSNAPSITFTQDMETSMPNGISDLAPLFVNHTHNYDNYCQCTCGDIQHLNLNYCSRCGLKFNEHGYYNNVVYYACIPNKGWNNNDLHLGVVFHSDGTISISDSYWGITDSNILYVDRNIDRNYTVWNENTRIMNFYDYPNDTTYMSSYYFVISEDGNSLEYVSDWGYGPEIEAVLTPRFDLVPSTVRLETKIYNQYGDAFVFHGDDTVHITNHETGEEGLYHISWRSNSIFDIDEDNHHFGNELYVSMTGDSIYTMYIT